jgi:hypothetical protein
MLTKRIESITNVIEKRWQASQKEPLVAKYPVKGAGITNF